MGIDWWRSWHGAPMDHKWAVIAARAGAKVGIVSAIAWALMDYASQQDDRGSVVGFDTETYAVYSGFSQDEIEAVIRAMEEKRFIVDGRLTNWEKRQPKREDNSTPRVTRHREMKRNETHGNAPEKEKDSDKERDTDKEKESRPLDSFDAVLLAIESITGLPSGADSTEPINELVRSKVAKCDIADGYQWLLANKRTVRYYSQLVGPAKTAQAKRLQAENTESPEEQTLKKASEWLKGLSA